MEGTPPTPSYRSLSSLLQTEGLLEEDPTGPLGPAGDSLLSRGVCCLTRRFPWGRGSDTYLQEVFLAVRKAAHPGTFMARGMRGAMKPGVIYVGEEKRYQVGDRVYVRMCRPDVVASGTCRFLGCPRQAEEDSGLIVVTSTPPSTEPSRGTPGFDGLTQWVGIELDKPYGRHDGEINGKRYFAAKSSHGVFALPQQVSKVIPAAPSWEGLPVFVHASNPQASLMAVFPHRPILAWHVVHRGGTYSVYRYSGELYSNGLSASKKAFRDHLAERFAEIHPRDMGGHLAEWSKAHSSGEAPAGVSRGEGGERGRCRAGAGSNSGGYSAVGAVQHRTAERPPVQSSERSERASVLRGVNVALDRQKAAFESVLAMMRTTSGGEQPSGGAGRARGAGQVEGDGEDGVVSLDGSDGDIEIEMEEMPDAAS